MKSAITLSALAALVAAQDISSLEQCARTCVENMRSGPKAEELGCSAEDWSCLCQNPDFTYGFRDCAREVCTDDASLANQAVEYAVQLCESNGVVVTAGPGASGSVSATATATGSDSDGGSGGSTIYATLTSDGSVITTPVSTVGGGNDDESESGNTSESPETPTGGAGGIVTTITTDGSTIVSTLTGGMVTTITSGGSTITSTMFGSATSGSGDATETGDSTATNSDGSSATDGADGEDDDSAAMRTTFPGVMAVAALAALLF